MALGGAASTVWAVAPTDRSVGHVVPPLPTSAPRALLAASSVVEGESAPSVRRAGRVDGQRARWGSVPPASLPAPRPHASATVHTHSCWGGVDPATEWGRARAPGGIVFLRPGCGLLTRARPGNPLLRRICVTPCARLVAPPPPRFVHCLHSPGRPACSRTKRRCLGTTRTACDCTVRRRRCLST
jgi:hypothetical protein